MRAHGVGVYTRKKSRIGHFIFYLTDYIQSSFDFNIGVPTEYLDFFALGNFCILHERAYGVGVYTPKQSRKGQCIFFLTDYIQSNFAFNIGEPR